MTGEIRRYHSQPDDECNRDLSPTIYDLREESILPFVYSQATGKATGHLVIKRGMSVITSQKAAKRYGLFALAILLLMLGGVGIYFGSHNYPIRSLGIMAILASIYLVRISRVRGRSVFPEASGRTMELTTEGPGHWLWIVSLVLVPLLGAAFYLMHIDFANGGHEAWPVYVFAGVALACIIIWSYLAAFGWRAGPR